MGFPSWSLCERCQSRPRLWEIRAGTVWSAGVQMSERCLCAISSRKRWAFLGMVTSKSLVSSHTLPCKGAFQCLKQKVTRPHQAAFFILLLFIFNAYFLLAVTGGRQVSCWFLGLPTEFFQLFFTRVSFFLLVLMRPDASLMISRWCCAPSASETGIKCALKCFALV